MKHPTRVLLTFALASRLTPVAPVGAQSLPDSLVQRIRAGAARLVLSADSVVLPLVGTTTVPLVEVRVNGVGPYRFLIDLGSNVTLVRRNVVDESGSTVLVDRPTSDIASVGTIGLGSAHLQDATVASYDHLDVDGVLGYNVLQYSSFTLDFPGKRLVLHRRPLPPPNNRTVFVYRVEGRMPYVMVGLGQDSLLLNLDTGASEWMTVPPTWQTRLRWRAPPTPGRTTFNNQTGRTRVLEGYLADTLRFGELVIPSPLVYVNPDAEDAWLGAAAMASAVWTFDPQQRRVRISVAARGRSPTPNASTLSLRPLRAEACMRNIDAFYVLASGAFALTPIAAQQPQGARGIVAAQRRGVVIACRHAITAQTNENEMTLRYDDAATQRPLSTRGERRAETMGKRFARSRYPSAK